MPKALKVHPNERVDIPDFERAANDYTNERAAFEGERTILDRRSRVLEGFRIQIEDQTATPGAITVFNGSALDRDGYSLHDEDQTDAGVTLTLSGASTTFYVEVELSPTETDTDARAFWDPTFANTGVIPDGAEFSISVATRIAATWRVVQPVSTTGFDSTTNPNSTKIPLAVLITNGSNVINSTATVGLVQVDAASVTESTISAGGTSLRVFDSRLLGNVGDSVALGFGLGTQETAVLLTNDKDNGIITFAATANAHGMGEIVQAAGTGRLMQEKQDPNNPAAHPDSTRRLWQGDEVRGGALAQSKDALADRSDLNVRALKDKIDLLDAQLRELKFGSFDPGVVSSDPPTVFPARPRYFHQVGSVAGARFPTVSIGDGTGTFGDYNGANHTPFVDAIAFLTAAGGGVLLVKEGNYVFTSTVSITVPITIIGAGKEVTTITNNVAASNAFTITLAAPDDNNKVIMEDITCAYGTGSIVFMTLETVSLVVRNCDFTCVIGLTGGTGVNSRILADLCLFQPSSTAAILANSVSTYEEVLTNSVFNNCTYYDGTGSGSFVVATVRNTQFLGCSFTGGGIIASSTGTLSHYNIALRDCQASLTTTVMSVIGAVDRLSVEGCHFIMTAVTSAVPVLNFTGAVNTISLVNNKFDTTWSGTTTIAWGRLIKFNAAATNVVIQNNEMLVNSGQVVDHIAFEGADSLVNILIQNNKLYTFFRGVRVSSAVVSSKSLAVRDNLFDGGIETFLQHGILVEDGYNSVHFDGNVFQGIDGGAVLKRCITILSPVDGTTGSITNNTLSVGLTVSAAADSAGIWVDATGGVECNLNIRGNFVSTCKGVGNIYGIYVNCGVSTVYNRINVCDNHFIATVVGSGLSSTYVAGIWIQNVNNAVVSRNSFIEGIAPSSDGNAICIVVTSSAHVLVSTNDITLPDIGGTPVYGCGILLLGANDAVSVRDNTLQSRTASSSADAIIIDPDTASVNNIAIENNTITWGASLAHGIRYASSSTGACAGLSVCGNLITGLDAAGANYGIRLLFTAASTARGIKVNNNIIEETAFSTTNNGISLVGNSTPTANAVQVNNNVVRGDLSGTGTRNATTGVGISVSLADIYQINSNLLDWCDAGIDGISIRIDDSKHGSIIGNVCRPGSSTLDEILHATSAAGAIIGGNIVGSSAFGAGTITHTATDVLKGTDNTSTEFTNKVS